MTLEIVTPKSATSVIYAFLLFTGSSQCSHCIEKSSFIIVCRVDSCPTKTPTWTKTLRLMWSFINPVSRAMACARTICCRGLLTSNPLTRQDHYTLSWQSLGSAHSHWFFQYTLWRIEFVLRNILPEREFGDSVPWIRRSPLISVAGQWLPE